MIRKSKLLSPRTAVLVTFMINGALMATWVSRIPLIQTKFHLTEGLLGWLFFSSSLGFLLALVLAGGLIARFGSHKIILGTAIAGSLLLPLVALAPQIPLLVVCLILFGMCISLMDVAMNEQAVLVEREAGKPMMSSFHGGYSIGAACGAFIGAGIAALPGVSLFQHFLLIACLALLVSLGINHHLEKVKVERSAKSKMFRLPERALWLLGSIAFVTALGEGISSDWSGVYLKNVLGTDSSTAALGYAFFAALMTLGRMLGDWLRKKLHQTVIVRAGGLTAAAGFMTAALAHEPWLAIMGLGLSGFGLANIIPLVYGAAGNSNHKEPGTGIAGVATIGYVGFLIGPPMVGTLADAFSLRVSFMVVAVFLATIFISGKKLPQ